MANKFMQDIKQNRKIAITALVVGSVALLGVIALTIIVLI